MRNQRRRWSQKVDDESLAKLRRQKLRPTFPEPLRLLQLDQLDLIAPRTATMILRAFKSPVRPQFPFPFNPRPSTNPAQALRQTILHPRAFAPRATTPQQLRLLSDVTRKAIDKAVSSSPVVLFMKGTPEMPQCGFSRASIEILGVQGVDPAKFSAFNVLEDEELRQGEFNIGWAAASVGGWVGRDGVLTCAQE
jgi:hypothetical protein